MNRIWIPVLLLGFVAAIGSSTAVPRPPETDCSKLAPPAGNTGAFLMLSDVHLDPFADDNVATPYGQDTKYPLLKSALQAAADISQTCNINYDYGTVTGDYTYHRQSSGDYADSSPHSLGIVESISGMLRYFFPGVPAFGALGNNDSDTGNYKIPSEPYLNDVRNYLVSRNQFASFAKPFQGYYRAAVAPGAAPRKNEIVALNTNIWSNKTSATCSPDDAGDEGTRELKWLGETLAAMRGDGHTATLVMHIPPGIDVYATLNPSSANSLPDEEERPAASAIAPQTTPLWKPACQAEFIDILSRYSDVVVDIDAAHIHRDDFRILFDANHKAICPVHLIPAISPIYDNNPAFEIGWYDKASGALVDYAAFYLNLAQQQTDAAADKQPSWELLYRFTSDYGYSEFDTETLQSLAGALRSYDSDASKKYRYNYASGATPERKAMEEHWAYYVCAITELTVDGYNDCVKRH